MRKWLRSIARENMERRNIQHKNKKQVNPSTGRIMPSKFAMHWRDFADLDITPLPTMERVRAAREAEYRKRQKARASGSAS